MYGGRVLKNIWWMTEENSMCVALPGKVIEINGRDAVVDFSGNKVTARAGLVDIKVGDYVLVHAGCVIQKVSKQDMEDLENLNRLMGN